MELEYCGATFQFNIQKFHQITKYYLVFIEPNIELRVTSSTFQFNIQDQITKWHKYPKNK